MQKQVALYNSVEYTWNTNTLREVFNGNPDDSDCYVRISNVLTLDFSMLDENLVNQNLIAKLEVRKEELKLETIQAMETIDTRIQELKAITYQED